MIPINKRSVGKAIVLSIISFGIYSLYWEYLLVKNTKSIKHDNSSCTGEMLCLLFVPFYSFYWWYTRGCLVKKEFSEHNYAASGNGIIYLVLCIFGLSFISMAIMQKDFNSLHSETQQIQRSVSSGKIALDAIETGIRNTMGVSLACGLAGIVAGIVTLTSLGSTLINIIVPLAQDNLFIALFLTMLTCIVLGMGVPTTANYLIMATITAPILTEMGLPVLAAHMFVFYFGIVADITPPVALAAYAGSAIAHSNPFKTGVIATKLAIAAFIIPYIFAFNPKMLFIEATVLEVVVIIITSFVGIFALSSGLEGFMLKRLRIYERLPLILGGLLMIYPGHITDLVGFIIVAGILVSQIILRKKSVGRA